MKFSQQKTAFSTVKNVVICEVQRTDVGQGH